MRLPKIRKNHYGEKDLKNEIKFDPETQYAVIRSSICTGEKVAGFKNKKESLYGSYGYQIVRRRETFQSDLRIGDCQDRVLICECLKIENNQI